ncbi:MAG: hypothetical protein QXP58_02945 [Thermoprotei archaeon]
MTARVGLNPELIRRLKWGVVCGRIKTFASIRSVYSPFMHVNTLSGPSSASVMATRGIVKGS